MTVRGGKGSSTCKQKQSSRGKEMTARYVQMAQQTAAVGNRPDYTSVTRCPSYGEGAQVW